MILHLTETYSLVVADAVDTDAYSFSLYPNREQSRNALSNRLALVHDGLLDFEWHSPADLDGQWVIDDLGARDVLRARTADRADFFRTIYDISPGTFLVPASRPDRLAEAARYAREAIDVLPDDAEVWATIPISRPSLTDPAVLMQLNQIHRQVSGIYLVVVDNAGFPAAWSEQELREYLRLVGAQVLSGRDVIAAHSDVRGLLAVAVGASELGTGVVKAMKQYGTPTGGGGAQPGQPPPSTQSYVAMPLLATMHAGQAETVLGDQLKMIESHNQSLPHCQLDNVPPPGEAWAAWSEGEGNANATRGIISAVGLAAAEEQLRQATDSADLMQEWLESAAALAQDVPAEAFQTAGLRAEVLARPDVFNEARESLGI